MRSTLLTSIFASLLLAQVPRSAETDLPTVITFVAPAYPQAAKNARIMGKTLARIVIGSNGVVSEVKTITAHPVFKDYVVEALKKWRFTLSEQAHTLQITCIFEFEDYEKCEESGKFPANSETYISAELPTVVHIKRALPCFDINR